MSSEGKSLNVVYFGGKINGLKGRSSLLCSWQVNNTPISNRTLLL